MSKIFYYQYDCSQKILGSDQQEFLVSSVAAKWDKFDKLRQPNVLAYQAVENVIYPSKKCSANKNDIAMPEIYEIRESYKAHLWKSWFSSLDTMFDVQGRGQNDHKNANLQKAALVDVFRDIDLISKFDRGLDNWINKGEFIGFVHWNTKINPVRKKKYFAGADGVVSSGGAQFVLENEVDYDGPDFSIVSPEAFVFDPDKKDNFDSCPKIYRSWATYDEISEDSLYSNFEGLKDFARQNSSNSAYSKAVRGEQLEILEFWGDIKLKNGVLLKNYVITVVGRSKIIRFEPNPFLINPFVFACFLEDPETKRGISPLYVALPLNSISGSILNLQLEALKLIVNKPYLAPRGCLSGKINITEGAIIEYDPALMPKEPIPLDFKDALVGWDFLSFFESKIESTTGIYKYMTGTSDGGNKTATEASSLVTGQNIRMSKEVDNLNFKVKIPLIKKIALLLSNFTLDKKEIKISKNNGDIDFATIDESVRQGKYDYIIGDSSAIQERKLKLKENLEVLYGFAKIPDVASRIKWLEVAKWTFEQLGCADSAVFISDESIV